MDDKNKKTSFLSALLSVMAGAFGVQKRKNMERDFQASNPVVYVAAGLVFLALFIGTLVGVVTLVAP